MTRTACETAPHGSRRQTGASDQVPPSSARRRHRSLRRGLYLLFVLACVLVPGTGHTLSCLGTPAVVVLAANCTDGVCTDPMTMRQRTYRSYWCSFETRPVVVAPASRWLPVPEIAQHLGVKITSGVYEIRTYDDCLYAMARRRSRPSWADERSRCLQQSSVTRVSEDAGGQAFDRLRSDWRATERAGLIYALPTIVLGSYPAKIAVLVATIAAIILPWALAWRGRFAPGRTTLVFLAAIVGQMLILLIGRTTILMSSDMWSGGDRGLALAIISVLSLTAAIVIQIGVLFARWSVAIVAKRRLGGRSSSIG